MKQRKRLFNFFLWWAVIGFSIWFGGTIFSMSVIVPMWSDNLPESARVFFSETTFAKYIYNFFGPPWMALRNLPLFIALALGWYSKKHRTYLLISSLILISAIVFTISIVYTMNYDLMLKAGSGYSDADLTILAKKWILADRLRFAAMIVGYFFLLKAFRLPIHDRVTQKPK
ncbi:MAG: hypothetical protein WBN18_13610 [Flavobacteriaceae bacterium]